MNKSSQIAIAAAVAAFMMGVTIVLTRSIIDQIGPGSLAMLRYFIAFLILLPFFIKRPAIKIPPRDLIAICVIGVFQFGVVITLMNIALQTMPSGRAALIFSIAPFIALLLGALLGRENFTWAKALGIFFTIVGVGFALGEHIFATHGATAADFIGEIAILGSAFFFAACSVLYRPYLDQYAILPVSIYALISSVAFLFVMSLFEGFWSELPQLDLQGWLVVLLIGASSCTGYYIWLWALERTTATYVTAYLALNPITALALGAIFLGEPITILFMLGLLFVGVGLGMMQKHN